MSGFTVAIDTQAVVDRLVPYCQEFAPDVEPGWVLMACALRLLPPGARIVVHSPEHGEFELQAAAPAVAN